MTGLAGRCALVTGGGTGIGKAIALDMAAAGARVLICGRRQAPLDETLAEFPDGAIAGRGYVVDLTEPDATVAFAQKLLEEIGTVDILVNNAGFSSKVRSARYISAEEWRGVMDVNTLGPVLLTRELLPGMIDRGHGDVVMISSLAGIRPNVMAGVAYSAAKSAARAYMEVLTAEVRRYGIRCITVFPGEVDTPILENRALPPDEAARSVMMLPEDISAVVMMAVGLPQRATVSEIAIGATVPRDMSADVKAALTKKEA
jgi:NAD(P)-dependent dehydrogenase (short-subunit alcohol dehydrogenase family)